MKDTMIKTKDSPIVQEAIAAMAMVSAAPDIHWILGDDLCDCVFQRIGEWSNPYIAQTLRVRICCLFEKLYEQYPELVQRIDAYYDLNRHIYVSEPAEWDSDEMDMPIYLWHRQLAKKLGHTLEWVRDQYKNRKHERPKKVKVHHDKRPTERELAHAQEARLRASGWLI